MYHKHISILPISNVVAPGRTEIAPEDVLMTKAALGRLDYYPQSRKLLSPKPDDELWEGIELLQRSRGLQMDSTINPAGPTAQEIGGMLTERIEIAGRRRRRKGAPTEAECEHLY